MKPFSASFVVTTAACTSLRSGFAPRVKATGQGAVIHPALAMAKRASGGLVPPAAHGGLGDDDIHSLGGAGRPRPGIGGNDEGLACAPQQGGLAAAPNPVFGAKVAERVQTL